MKPRKRSIDQVDDVTLGRAVLEGLFDDQLGITTGEQWCQTCDITWADGAAGCWLCGEPGIPVEAEKDA